MMSRPIEVLRVIPTIDPLIGGPSNSSVNAAIAESGAAVTTTMVATANRPELERMATTGRRLSDAGVKLIAFPYLRWAGTRGSTLGLSLGMIRWLLGNIGRFDVVHLHYVWSLTTIVGAFWARAKGVPVVLTAHESLTEYDIDITSGSRLKRMAKLALRRFLMRRVDCVVCASEIELRGSLRSGETGVVVSHPIAPAVERMARTPEGDRFRVGFLGRLHPKKGLARLLEAFSTLGGDAELIICGDGEEGFVSGLKALAERLGLADRVEWRGHVGPEGKQELFSQIGWAVMPSDFECFGMAGAEAISAGVPVIVSSQTGIAPIVERYECGFVLDLETDPDGLGPLLATVRDTVSAPDWYELSENALRGAGEALTFGAYRGEIESVYRDVLGD